MSQLAPSIGSNRVRLDAREPATSRLIVTIDGPAGTGKSSVARDLSLALGLDFLDTGAMYRAATALAIDHRIDHADAEAMSDLVRNADLRFDWTTDPPTLQAFGRSIMHRLRDQDVTAAVSPVSSIPEVRRVLVERQRRIGEAHQRLVSEGRDQGSVVFPDADVKFFLSASPSVRALRRRDQLRASGKDIDVRQLEREIIERDKSDSERNDGPLTCPAGAFVLDTSDIGFEQVLAILETEVRRHMLHREQMRSGHRHPSAMVKH